MKFGAKVREAREMRGMTADQLAKICGMRRQFLLDIEDEITVAHTLTYRKICDALGITLEMLTSKDPIKLEDITLESEVPSEYLFLIKSVMTMCLSLGALLLIFGVVTIASWVLTSFFYSPVEPYTCQPDTALTEHLQSLLN